MQIFKNDWEEWGKYFVKAYEKSKYSKAFEIIIEM